MSFIKVAAFENEEVIELPCEIDGTILLSTLVASFPGACNLKYKSDTGTTRAIRNDTDRLHPPNEGWGDRNYFCVFQIGKIRF